MQTAQEIINDLLEDGFSHDEIAVAMLDGEYLAGLGIDQDTAEDIYDICEKQL